MTSANDFRESIQTSMTQWLNENREKLLEIVAVSLFESVAEVLTKTQLAHQDSEAIGGFGRSLDLILDEVENPFEKAKALRTLAEEMKKYGDG